MLLMTLEEALKTGLPFKAKYHSFWIDPKNLPRYIEELRTEDKYLHGVEWEVGTFEQLASQDHDGEIPPSFHHLEINRA